MARATRPGKPWRAEEELPSPSAQKFFEGLMADTTFQLKECIDQEARARRKDIEDVKRELQQHQESAQDALKSVVKSEESQSATIGDLQGLVAKLREDLAARAAAQDRQMQRLEATLQTERASHEKLAAEMPALWVDVEDRLGKLRVHLAEQLSGWTCVSERLAQLECTKAEIDGKVQERVKAHEQLQSRLGNLEKGAATQQAPQTAPEAWVAEHEELQARLAEVERDTERLLSDSGEKAEQLRRFEAYFEQMAHGNAPEELAQIPTRGSRRPGGAWSFECVLGPEYAESHFGLSLDVWHQGVEVIDLKAGGRVESYNASAKEDVRVRPGDFVVVVNGAFEPQAICRELTKKEVQAEEVRLRILRPTTRLVTVDKQGKDLGLRLKFREVSVSMQVERILEGGAVAAHNARSAPEDKIVLGDLIASVNGAGVTGSATRMNYILATSPKAELHVLKFPQEQNEQRMS